MLHCSQHGRFASYTSSTADAASAVPLPPLGKARERPEASPRFRRGRRPRRPVKNDVTLFCNTSSVNLRLTPSPAGEGKQRGKASLNRKGIPKGKTYKKRECVFCRFAPWCAFFASVSLHKQRNAKKTTQTKKHPRKEFPLRVLFC